jgi:GTP-binding protein Era
MEYRTNQDESALHSGTVAIVGPPNAGKSTLLNVLLGQKVSIVSSKPQTTRNKISGILNQKDAQIVFIDTPGIHYPKTSMNHYIVNMARETLLSTDIVLLVLDGFRYTKNPGLLPRELDMFRQDLATTGQTPQVVINKIDTLNNKREILPLIDKCAAYWPEAEIFPVSARQGLHTENLLDHLVGSLPQGMAIFPEDQLSTLPLRFMASELIREQLFQELKQELPYSIAVQIEDWQEIPENNLISIHALIYVAKSNHKHIVIGRKGELLKKIGQMAREELVYLTGQRVHLELWVKVKPQWNEDKRLLRQLVPNIL